MKTIESSIVYDANNNIIAIVSSSQQQAKKSKIKINWKNFIIDEVIPTIIMLLLEFLFIAYCFHRLGCF